MSKQIARLEKSAAKPKKLTAAQLISEVSKHLNEDAALIVKMHIRHARKPSWTKEEKEFALSFYYRSPRAYNYLRELRKMALPCVTVIREWMNEITLSTSFNSAFFAKLRHKADHMLEWEKDYSLMWDEMAIRELLEYDPKTD